MATSVTWEASRSLQSACSRKCPGHLCSPTFTGSSARLCKRVVCRIEAFDTPIVWRIDQTTTHAAATDYSTRESFCILSWQGGGVETNSFGIGSVAIPIPETNISSAVSRQRVLQNDDTSQQTKPSEISHGTWAFEVHCTDCSRSWILSSDCSAGFRLAEAVKAQVQAPVSTSARSLAEIERLFHSSFPGYTYAKSKVFRQLQVLCWSMHGSYWRTSERGLLER